MKEQNLTSRAHECSIIGCPRITVLTKWADPRERWLLDVPLKDGEETKIVNFCPVHAQELFFLKESDYTDLERTEQMIAQVSNERSV